MDGAGSVVGLAVFFAKGAEGATGFLGLFVRGARASLGRLPAAEAFCFLSAFAFAGVISRFPAFSFPTSLVDFSITVTISPLVDCSLALCSSLFSWCRPVTSFSLFSCSTFISSIVERSTLATADADLELRRRLRFEEGFKGSGAVNFAAATTGRGASATFNSSFSVPPLFCSFSSSLPLDSRLQILASSRVFSSLTLESSATARRKSDLLALRSASSSVWHNFNSLACCKGTRSWCIMSHLSVLLRPSQSSHSQGLVAALAVSSSYLATSPWEWWP